MNRYYLAGLAAPVLLALNSGLFLATPASADEYLFGFSGYDGNETLTLDLASGGAPVVLSTDGHQGWWSATYANSPGDSNYFVGTLTLGRTIANLRDFFSFDISPLVGQTVSAATLGLSVFASVSDSGRAGQQYTLHGVSVPPTLLDDTGGASAAIYDALGEGVVYGSFSVPVTGFGFGSDAFALNAAGVAALNAAIADGASSFSIGGSLPAATVPEPAALPVIVAGWFALGFARRRRTARAAVRRPLTIA